MERIRLYQKCLTKNKELSFPLRQIDLSSADVQEATSWCVLAPVLHTFVIWTLQQALAKKVERLYFLSRDGYLMFKTAEKIVEQLKLPIVCHYLYCSRYSMRTPLFHLDMDETRDYICRNSIRINLETILKRTGLKRAKRVEIIQELAWDGSSKEEIPYAGLKEVRTRLHKSKLFNKYVTENSKRLLPALESYLRQEGLLDGGNYAIVDSGWTGSTQKTLNQALAYFGVKEKVRGYYFGLYTLPPKEDQKEYHAYYFYPDQNLKEKIYFSNSLFEAIFSAPHGMTLGYHFFEGKSKPFFLPLDEDSLLFSKKTEQIMLQYTKLLLDGTNRLMELNTLAIKNTVYKLLKLFMANPTKEEVTCFGNILFCDDVFEDAKQPIAVRLTEAELANHKLGPKIMMMLGLRRGKIKESGWHEGSVRKHHKYREYLKQYAAYKGLLYLRTAVRWKLAKWVKIH